jgi:hypothetical protein
MSASVTADPFVDRLDKSEEEDSLRSFISVTSSDLSVASSEGAFVDAFLDSPLVPSEEFSQMRVFSSRRKLPSMPAVKRFFIPGLREINLAIKKEILILMAHLRDLKNNNEKTEAGAIEQQLSLLMELGRVVSHPKPIYLAQAFNESRWTSCRVLSVLSNQGKSFSEENIKSLNYQLSPGRYRGPFSSSLVISNRALQKKFKECAERAFKSVGPSL